jgi:hypothetical protein
MNIVILSQPRTGSNLLSRIVGNFFPFRELSEFFITEVDAKNVDPDILPYNIFLSKLELSLLIHLLKTDSENLLKTVHTDIVLTIETLNKFIQNTKIFKIQNHQITDEQLLQLLDNPTLKFIVLERKNKLKQYASTLVAGQVKKFFCIDTSDCRVNIDVEKYNTFKNNTEKWYVELKQKLIDRNINFLDIVYEDDLEFLKEEQLSEKIKNWLNQENIPYVKYINRDPLFFKQNKTPIEKTVLNYNNFKETK